MLGFELRNRHGVRCGRGVGESSWIPLRTRVFDWYSVKTSTSRNEGKRKPGMAELPMPRRVRGSGLPPAGPRPPARGRTHREGRCGRRRPGERTTGLLPQLHPHTGPQKAGPPKRPATPPRDALRATRNHTRKPEPHPAQLPNPHRPPRPLRTSPLPGPPQHPTGPRLVYQSLLRRETTTFPAPHPRPAQPASSTASCSPPTTPGPPPSPSTTTPAPPPATPSPASPPSPASAPKPPTPKAMSASTSTTHTSRRQPPSARRPPP